MDITPAASVASDSPLSEMHIGHAFSAVFLIENRSCPNGLKLQVDVDRQKDISLDCGESVSLRSQKRCLKSKF